MSTDTITDPADVTTLWGRVLGGDTAAFRQWHGLYEKRLLLFLRARCRPPLDPDDLAQIVWTRVWERRAQWDPARGQFISWLFHMASNELNTVLRRRQSRPEQALGEGCEPAAPSAAPEPPHLDALRECLKQLAGKFVEVLKLRLEEELDDGQIAERLGITVPTVYKYATYGRGEVRQCVERKLP